jgi:GTPase SAR1 family protein
MKILLLGNSGAGKSCLLMQFTEKKFTPNYYNTIGVDYVHNLDYNI